jgi:opacity protein-like surface antigen
MRCKLLVMSIALAVTAASAWAQAAPAPPATIEIRKSLLFGPTFYYQNKKLNDSDLWGLYSAVQAGEAMRLLDQSFYCGQIGKYLSIPGAIVAGWTLGGKDRGKRLSTTAAVGISAMVVRVGFSLAADDLKERSAKSFGGWVSETHQAKNDLQLRAGFGFTTNIPNQWLGFCLFYAEPGQVGLYLDLKTGVPVTPGGDDLYEHISVSQAESWGDPLRDKKNTWLSMNVGATFPVASRLAIYAGAGYSNNSKVRNYYDPLQILGTNGSYWVKDGDTNYLNGIGGVLIILGPSWGLQVGGEAKPRGVTSGIFRTL